MSYQSLHNHQNGCDLEEEKKKTIVINVGEDVEKLKPNTAENVK